MSKNKLLEKQTDRNIHFKDLVITYVELEKRLKALGKDADNRSS